MAGERKPSPNNKLTNHTINSALLMLERDHPGLTTAEPLGMRVYADKASERVVLLITVAPHCNLKELNSTTRELRITRYSSDMLRCPSSIVQAISRIFNSI
jgi:hypothetical protein